LRLKQLAAKVKIPTNDNEVKIRLRELGKPIILFGEKAPDRRERLRQEVLDKTLADGRPPTFRRLNINKSETVKEGDEFFSEGTNELRQIREEIAKYSIPRAAYRLEVSKKKFMDLDRIQDSMDHANYLETCKGYEFISSQFADDRGCARGALSHCNSYFGVAGWSGDCNILDTKTLKHLTQLKGHSDRVNSISFHPEALTEVPEVGPCIGTASSDGLVKLWSLKLDWETQKSANFKGHEDRVNSVDFHPMGKVIASASHDKTWRLWDIETKRELLVQEGHIYPVYTISFQKDGALLATGDLSGIGLVWDLRTGKCILPLEGHVKQIRCLKFSNNCYQLVSGSDDNSLKVWDLRRKGCIYTVPAHNQAISDVCFEKDSRFVISCSYDSSFKIWNNRDWSIVKSFSSSTEGKLTSISITKDNKNILTTSLDRTVKLWSLKNNVTG
jgi:U4/U6 small nuclear ribonucleoprotein PRP4